MSMRNRNRAIWNASERNVPQSEIAREHNLSQSRVAQIVTKERARREAERLRSKNLIYHRLDIESAECAAVERAIRTALEAMALDLNTDEPILRAVLRRLQDLRMGFGHAGRGRAPIPRLPGRRGHKRGQGYGRGKPPALPTEGF